LVSLLGCVDGVKQVFGFGEDLPQFDLQFPLMSLPLVLGGSPENLPIQFPYLVPDREAASAWRGRVARRAARGVSHALTSAGWGGGPGDKSATLVVVFSTFCACCYRRRFVCFAAEGT